MGGLAARGDLELALIDQFTSQADEPCRIHDEQARGGSADGGKTDDGSALDGKMGGPTIAARIEQVHLLFRLGIDAD